MSASGPQPRADRDPPGYAASPLRKGASVVQRLTNPSCVAPCLPPPSHRQQLGLDLRPRLRAVGHLLTLGHPVFSSFLRILRQTLPAQAVVLAVDPLHHLLTLRYPIPIAIPFNGAIFCHVPSDTLSPPHFHFPRADALPSTLFREVVGPSV